MKTNRKERERERETNRNRHSFIMRIIFVNFRKIHASILWALSKRFAAAAAAAAVTCNILIILYGETVSQRQTRLNDHKWENQIMLKKAKAAAWSVSALICFKCLKWIHQFVYNICNWIRPNCTIYTIHIVLLVGHKLMPDTVSTHSFRLCARITHTPCEQE